MSWVSAGRLTGCDLASELSALCLSGAGQLLCLTLGDRPWKVLAKDKLTVAFDLRRDIGIWAGLAGLFHTGFRQFAHLRGRPLALLYLWENWQEEHGPTLPPRTVSAFPNDAGLIASLTAAGAGAGDLERRPAALRKLGAPGWKKLQRWNGYACFTAFHRPGHDFRLSEGRLPVSVRLKRDPWRRPPGRHHHDLASHRVAETAKLLKVRLQNGSVDPGLGADFVLVSPPIAPEDPTAPSVSPRTFRSPHAAANSRRAAGTCSSAEPSDCNCAPWQRA